MPTKCYQGYGLTETEADKSKYDQDYWVIQYCVRFGVTTRYNKSTSR